MFLTKLVWNTKAQLSATQVKGRLLISSIFLQSRGRVEAKSRTKTLAQNLSVSQNIKTVFDLSLRSQQIIAREIVPKQ